MQIDNFVGYFCSIIVFTLGIRIVLSMFKTAAIRQGEAGYRFIKLTRRQAFWWSFWSLGHHRNLDDYWLPAIIGIMEFFFYPILIVSNEWIFISAWLGIKTVVQWKKWPESRTPYNRFLFGNLIVIVLSYFFLTRFLTTK